MKIQKLEDTKAGIAEQLRAFAGNPTTHAYSIAAIEGLGELGGAVAVNHINELMEIASNDTGVNGRETWAALLRAYGRAGRFLPE